MSFEFLFQPLEQLDAWLEGLFSGAPLLAALGIALVLGLRHASDPDHLVAVTSLVAADGGDTRAATRLGAWWGVGHGLTLLVIGLPLIFFKSELPAWLEAGAEKTVGVVILFLAARVIYKWVKGDYRVTAHGPSHAARTSRTTGTSVAGTCGAAQAATATGTCARRVRPSASGCCTGSPAPAPWCSC